MKDKGVGRREFGKILGAASVGGVLSGPARAAPVETRQEGTTRDSSPRADAYTFFTAEEAAFVDAAASRLIPSDELGPGAQEAGVSVFIDRQLAGAYGSAAKWYMQGPFGESLPEQGYQRPLTPQELYRLAIEKVNELCWSRHDARFDRLTSEQQDTLLSEMERGDLPVEDAPQREFFAMLHANTLEGFFSDPIYGGNRDKVGWRLVGFPGVGGSYRERIERYGEAYDVEPVSIEDVMERRARVDAHGHVIHAPRGRRTGKGGGR